MEYSINCKGKIFALSTPKIMGILNITPDSFSDGTAYLEEKSALLRVEEMLKEGAEIIDIGAQSTRPNATKIGAKDEIDRLKTILPAIKREFPDATLSLDTFYTAVLEFGYNEGIDIVNDVSAGNYDDGFLEMVRKSKLPYILMHNHSNYQKMHFLKSTENIVEDLNHYFLEKIEHLYSLGIDDIILDPGFGFGKSIEDQYKIINQLEHIGLKKHPVLIGISRKSFIYKPINKTPLDIISETQALHLKALEKGVKILRVHDVAETKKTIQQFLSNEARSYKFES